MDDRTTKIQELVYEMNIGEVMHQDVITVSSKMLMSELRVILHDKRISGTPVVDQDRLVGIISIEDFIRWLAGREEDCPIGERMTKTVHTLYADEPLIAAVSKFDQFGFGRFAVLDRRDEKLVGIISRGDIVKGLLKKLEIDYHDEEIRRYRASHIFEDIVADKTRLSFQYNVIGRDFTRAGEGASRLKTTLKRLGLPPQIVRRVAIATYEAEMNVVIFTDGGTVRVRVDPREIYVKVEDSGPGIPDVEKALQPGYSTAPAWVRELGFGAGMGLVNIKRCADKMKLRSDVGKGTHLDFHVFIESGARSETN